MKAQSLIFRVWSGECFIEVYIYRIMKPIKPSALGRGHCPRWPVSLVCS
jgi:hypothetical protein